MGTMSGNTIGANASFSRARRTSRPRLRVTVGDWYGGKRSIATEQHDFAADLAVARADDLLREGEEGTPEFRTGWKWDKLQEAFMTEKFRPYIAATAHLIRCATEEEYAAACDADAARWTDRRRECGQ